MVNALQSFNACFQTVKDSFAVIGGCACAEWFGEAGLRFRNTMDIDMVLLVEAKDEKFFETFWGYVKAGNYNQCVFRKGEGKLFRFEREEIDNLYPKRIELLTGLDRLVCPEGVRIVSVAADDDSFDLSAILLEADYYDLVRNARSVSKTGMPLVNPEALLLLKAKAYLNLIDDRARGKKVKSKDITKHRNDVYNLSYLLSGHFSLFMTDNVKSDLRRFINIFQPKNESDWEAIVDHLKNFGRSPILSPLEYNSLIADYYLV